MSKDNPNFRSYFHPSEHIYQTLQIKWKHKTRYLLWLGLDEASVLQNKKGKLILFKKISCVKKYTSRKKLKVNTAEVFSYDFDEIIEGIKDKKSKVDSTSLLNTWNLLDDISRSLSIPFEGRNRDKRTNKIYDKLFAGNNLPSIKPKAEDNFIPLWTKKERKRMKRIFVNGFATLSKHIVVKKCF